MYISQMNTSGPSLSTTTGAAPAPRTAALPSPAPSSAPVAPATTAAQQDVQVKEAVAHINSTIQVMTSNIAFSTDAETGIKSVSVIDSVTKEVIRQMPSNEVIAVARALDKLQGLIIQQKA